tara:strand:+ start:1949 stop:2125 length:177 start_codon:yes stop_codon:yes gene_type:complete
MQALEINNSLCVVCNDKKYMAYASTCQKCYETTEHSVITVLTDIASAEANEELLKEIS